MYNPSTRNNPGPVKSSHYYFNHDPRTRESLLRKKIRSQYPEKRDIVQRRTYITDEEWKSILREFASGNFAVTYKIQEVADTIKRSLRNKIESDRTNGRVSKPWHEISIENLIKYDTNYSFRTEIPDIYRSEINPRDWRYTGFILEELLGQPHFETNVNEELLLKLEVLATVDSKDLLKVDLDNPFHHVRKEPIEKYEFDLERDMKKFSPMTKYLHAVRNLLCNRIEGLIPESLLTQFCYHRERGGSDELLMLRTLIPYIICPEKAVLVHAVLLVITRFLQVMPDPPSSLNKLSQFLAPAFFGNQLKKKNARHLTNFIIFLSGVDWKNWPCIRGYYSLEAEYLRCRIFSI